MQTRSRLALTALSFALSFPTLLALSACSGGSNDGGGGTPASVLNVDNLEHAARFVPPFALITELQSFARTVAQMPAGGEQDCAEGSLRVQDLDGDGILAVGDVYSLDFLTCASGDGPPWDGTVLLTLTELVGDPTGSEAWELGAEVELVNFSIGLVNEPQNRVANGKLQLVLAISAQDAQGRTDRMWTASGAGPFELLLLEDEPDTTVRLTDVMASGEMLEVAMESGSFSLAAGYTTSRIASPFTITTPQPITSEGEAPTNGTFRVQAQDGGALLFQPQNDGGSVRLGLDLDGNGVEESGKTVSLESVL